LFQSFGTIPVKLPTEMRGVLCIRRIPEPPQQDGSLGIESGRLHLIGFKLAHFAYLGFGGEAVHQIHQTQEHPANQEDYEDDPVDFDLNVCVSSAVWTVTQLRHIIRQGGGDKKFLVVGERFSTGF
jgi:hypothetical protein